MHVDHGTTHIAELMSAGKGVLINLGERTTLPDVASKWADRVAVVSARCYEGPANLEAMLVRPDGYIAWALSSVDDASESGILYVPLW